MQQRILKEFALLKDCEFVKTIKTGKNEDEITRIWQITLKTDDLDVECAFPDDFPFEPPLVQVKSCLGNSHPNIDSSGNICLDVLKLPPDGARKPTYMIVTVITALEMLLKNPNFSDPLNILSTEKVDNAEEKTLKKKSLSLRMPSN